jgi:hypothetical protein
MLQTGGREPGQELEGEAEANENNTKELENRKQEMTTSYDSCAWYLKQPETIPPPTTPAPPDLQLGKKTKNM